MIEGLSSWRPVISGGMYVRLSSSDHVVPRSDEVLQKIVLSPNMAFAQTIQILMSLVWVIEGRPSKVSFVVIRVMLTDQVTATALCIFAATMIMNDRIKAGILIVLRLMSVSPQCYACIHLSTLDGVLNKNLCLRALGRAFIKPCTVNNRYCFSSHPIQRDSLSNGNPNHMYFKWGI